MNVPEHSRLATILNNVFPEAWLNAEATAAGAVQRRR